MAKTSELVNYCIYEFVTKNGLSYVGKYITIENEKVIFENVLQINLRPVQVPNSQEFTMSPSLEVVGMLVLDNVFRVPVHDIYMIEEVTYSVFLETYRLNLEMYQRAKRSHGSNIELTDQMPTHDISVQRKQNL